jgi:hypothetical protein
MFQHTLDMNYMSTCFVAIQMGFYTTIEDEDNTNTQPRAFR